MRELAMVPASPKRFALKNRASAGPPRAAVLISVRSAFRQLGERASGSSR